MSAPSVFQYSEQKLCDHDGCSRTNAKAIRDRFLTEGVDWKKHLEGVALSASGVKKLWRGLKSRPRFDLSACLIILHKKNGAAVNVLPESAPIALGDTFAPIPIEVVVIKICPNLFVILVEEKNAGRLMVWVGRNDNYTVGMRLKIVPKIDMPGYWRLAGSPPQRKYSTDEWNRRQRAGLQG